jgi:hypothetical protein
MTRTLEYGPQDEVYQEKLGKQISAGWNGLRVSNHTPVMLQKFPGDCGTLVITHANDAQPEDLETIKKIMSLGGFGKVVATITYNNNSKEGNTYGKTKNLKKMYTKAGFRTAAVSQSSRKSYMDHAMMVYNLKDCEWKGYSGNDW